MVTKKIALALLMSAFVVVGAHAALKWTALRTDPLDTCVLVYKNGGGYGCEGECDATNWYCVMIETTAPYGQWENAKYIQCYCESYEIGIPPVFYHEIPDAVCGQGYVVLSPSGHHALTVCPEVNCAQACEVGAPAHNAPVCVCPD